MSRRGRNAALVALAFFQLGGSCGGGSGGGSRSVRTIESPDARCASIGSPFPPGFDFVPGAPELLWTIDFSPPTLIPFDFSTEPPVVSAAPAPFLLPFDSDGDGVEEAFLTPIPDDVEIPRPDLGLVTASGYEEVIFLEPSAGSLRFFEVSVPASFAAGDYPVLPPPGESAVRTAVSTFGCVRPPAGALDSRGEPISTSVPAAGFCDAGTPSYLASFTSGAALASGHLFVASSNLGDGAGSQQPQYLPGSVLVYDVDLAADPPRISPNAATPVILTSAFNPTHVTPYATATRSFVLVTVSGAIGIESDDPETPVLEAAGVAHTDAAIDVIDADSLELVATIPLGRAGLSFGRLAIDPGGRVAATGSAIGRWLLAVDLAPLDSLPSSSIPPLVLDGSTGPDAVIFDAASPFQIPGRSDGAPPETCPGFSAGVAFADDGEQLYVTDFCDGTLAVVSLELSPEPPSPVPADRFGFEALLLVASALRAVTSGLPRAPADVAVRPGRPGTDFDGPDVYFILGEPGLLCGIVVESS